MATKRIKDLTNTAASVASDAYLAIDGTSNGTEKITRDNFRQDTADAFVAAPGTYNLAPLSGGAVEVAKGGTGATTVAGARTNLEVNSIGEDAQANALKTTAPALYFDGSSSFVEVAHDAKQHFNDGTDDLPFSISAFVKMTDATNFVVVSKFTTVIGGEWMLNCEGDDLRLYLQTSSGNSMKRLSASAITGYEGQWVHLTATYAGTSGGVFSSAGDGITLFVNGQPVAMDAAVEAGTYAGMANGTQAVRIGSQQSVFSKGSIRDVKIFNRELTADEVAELARGNDLGFSEEWGGALGGVYTSTFVGTTNGWTAVNGTVNHSTSVGGESDALRLTLDGTTGGHYLQKTGVFTRGKRYRVKGRYYVPTNSHVDGIYFVIGTSGVVEVVRAATPTLDSWIDFSVEVVANATADTDRLLVYALDGNSTTVTDPGADDVIYILDLVVTEIGTLADFRAEDYNESASKLLDRSSNNFVGVGTSVTLTGNQRHISADTIDLKNLPTSSAGLSAGEVWSNGGVLTVV